MGRTKATITLDRAKADQARQLTGADSISDAIDVALDRLIADVRLRRDIAAYRRIPLDDVEVGMGSLPVTLDLDDDDIDYEALYGEGA